jgi:phage-related protein
MTDTTPKRETWTMPEWMEPYRQHIANTGGNSIEDLMNDQGSTVSNNVIRAALIVSVDSQIILLHRLQKHGFLTAVS